MSQRVLFLDGEIEQSLAGIVCLQIEAMRLTGTEPLRIIINSRGGDVAYGAQLIAALRELIRSGIEVTAEVRGDADSMAAIIACCCSRLEMNQLSRLMFHGVAGLTWGDVQDHEAERQEMDRLTDELVEVVFGRVRNPSSRFADRKADFEGQAPDLDRPHGGRRGRHRRRHPVLASSRKCIRWR